MVGRSVVEIFEVLVCWLTGYCAAGEVVLTAGLFEAVPVLVELFVLPVVLPLFELDCSEVLLSVVVFSSFWAVVFCSELACCFFYTLLIAEVISHAPKIKMMIAAIIVMIIILIRCGRLASWFRMIILHNLRHHLEIFYNLLVDIIRYLEIIVKRS